MCGVAGFPAAPGGDEASLATVSAMLDAMAHRGPDGRGAEAHSGMVLGTCRLTFVDGPGGAQPFTSASGRCAVVWNGEIYNHAELRRELLAAGGAPRTGSDTELIAELYEREGPAFLHRLRGMYALAVHDRVERRLLLARDPWGKKPLYYFESAAGPVFASELRALLRHPGAPTAVDPRALVRYLLFHAVPAPLAMVAGVGKVPPGAWIEWGPHGRREGVHWRLPLAEPPDGDASPAQLEARVEAALTAAVERRLRSTDQPLGVLLSGGLDSSLVAALAARLHAGPFPTFSAGFHDPDFDETVHAERVARHLGTEHHAVRLTGPAMAGLLEEVLPRVDEPLADSSLLPTVAVCRLAGLHVRGVLSGDGADELFMGYRFFQGARALRWVEAVLPGPLRSLAARAAAHAPVRHSNLSPSSVLRMMARAVGTPNARRHHAATGAFSPDEARALLTGDAWAAARGDDPWAALDAFAMEDPAAGPMEQIQRGIICHFLRDVILTKVDRGGMMNSVEVRSPFLDVELAALLARVPTALKLRGWESKHLLRRIAARHLPAEIVGRTKQGFRAPVGRLLCNEAAPLVREVLAPSRIASGGVFRPRAVAALVDEHLEGRRDHTRRLWALLCFQLWSDGRDADAAPAPAAHTLRPAVNHAA
jgi:asparagine synthase (glutamine-hydrolysing)